MPKESETKTPKKGMNKHVKRFAKGLALAAAVYGAKKVLEASQKARAKKQTSTKKK
jgi:hypothetical protein